MPPELVQQIVVGVALQLVATAALAAWGRWVAQRMGGGPWWKWASRGPWGSFVLLTVGMGIGIAMLMRAFDATTTVDPARKATVLAEGISSAMNVSVLFFVPGYLLLFAAVVTFVVGSLKHSATGPARAGAADPEREASEKR